MQMSFRSTLRSIINILRKLSCQKLICRKRKFCKIQGMSKGLKVHTSCNVARLYEISHVKGVKRNKNRHNRLDLGHLFLMLKESKVHSIYTIDPSIKSSNYMKI